MSRKPLAGRTCATLLLGLALTLPTVPVAVAQPSRSEPPATATVPPLGQPTNGRCAPPSALRQTEQPWAQQRLAPQRVWPLTRGDGQLVAVIDSGVDGRVPQLAGRLRGGVDVIGGSGGPEDDCVGHGTFVAGIIAAQPAQGTGLAGLAPGARILPVRQTVNGTDGSAAGMATAIRAAVDAGAAVINISAASFHSSPELQDAVRYAAQRDALIVASVANEAERGNPRSYPAAYPEVIAVGAVDRDGARGRFSQTGDFVDIAAPGVDVVSLSAAGTGHVTGNGTSFAAPFVSGTAALVRAYHPKLTAQQVKRRLEATADHPGRDLPDPEVGWGVVNPYAAVTAVLPEETGPKVPVAAPAVLRPPVWPAGVDRLQMTAIIAALAALLLAGLALVLLVLVPRGRRRGWRAAGKPSDAQSKRSS